LSNETKLEPRDHAEAVALFRVKVIGELTARELCHGELAASLRELSEKRFRPPESEVSRSYAVPTLERWYHGYRKRGLAGVTPRPRSDRGYGQNLTDAERKLLLDIRRDHRSMSTKVIVRALVREGRLRPGIISLNSLRRLYQAHGLERRSKRYDGPGKSRRTWEAAHPGKVWHADVCHGPRLGAAGKQLPLRVHGILDDNSRAIMAMSARHTELELDMLQLMTDALRRWGRPEVLYVDNGATYSGDSLRIFCSRLGIKLVHAEPYDPQARGKMERFWRTLREECLDHLPADATLHDAQVRLLATIDRAYHIEPHGSLMGQTPEQRWAQRPPLRPVTEQELREALTVDVVRRVSKTGTLGVAGIEWELEKGYLAGKKVRVFRSLVDTEAAPWVEWDGKRLPLHRLDSRKNAQRARAPVSKHRIDKVPFDPVAPLVDELAGRDPRKGGRS
jgi:transposase InsO family protein